MSNINEGGFLKGKKTYITAALGVLGAVGLYLTGEADLATALQTIIAALSAAFIRNGIKNDTK